MLNIPALLMLTHFISNFSEKVRRLVKARDSYGLVFDDVKKMQAMKHLRDSEAGPNPLPPGIRDKETIVTRHDSIVAVETDQSISHNPSANVPNQLSNMIKKAPTMPKPKWHPPWKLYRVIAGHLGWVRCIAVEPGNEVYIYLNYKIYKTITLEKSLTIHLGKGSYIKYFVLETITQYTDIKCIEHLL